MNLRTIPYLKETFHAPAGLSDHSLSPLPACAAVALGASAVEKHFCLDRGLPTPDAAFSTEPAEFAEMVRRIREVERVLGRVSFEPTPDEAANRRYRKSVFVTRAVKKGERFSPANLRVIRPADGLEPKLFESVLGKPAAVDLEPGTPLRLCHVKFS
jgi:pseudaminic acid synthase